MKKYFSVIAGLAAGATMMMAAQGALAAPLRVAVQVGDPGPAYVYRPAPVYVQPDGYYADRYREDAWRRREWREREWREHEWRRRHEWREQRWDERGHGRDFDGRRRFDDRGDRRFDGPRDRDWRGR